MKQQTTLPFDNGVASKIDRIIARCNGVVKTGSAYFDEFNETRARAIAARDAAVGDESGMSERQPKSRRVYQN